MLTDTALALGSNPYDLMKHMGTWNDEQIEGLQQVLEWFGDRDKRQQSGEVLAVMLKEANLAPPPPSRYTGRT